MLSTNYKIWNKDVDDLQLKIWVQANEDLQDPRKTIVTIVRLDNIEENVGLNLKNSYRTIHSNEGKLDTLWRDVRGWKGDLVLVIFDANHKERQIIIPSNEAFDSMQIRIEGLLLKGIEPKSMKIPRIIHQAGGDHKNDMLMVIKKSMTLLRINNPSYEHRVTSIEEMASYIGEREGERGLRAFMTLKPIAFKVDLFRLVALYHHGGVYLDSKLITISPLDAILPEKGGLLVKERKGIQGFQSAFMAMPKGDILMRRAIDKLLDNVENRKYLSSCVEVTGPKMLYWVFMNQLSYREKLEYESILEYEDEGRYIMKGSKREIIYHNGEYRRMMTFSKTERYDHAWNKRDIYHK